MVFDNLKDRAGGPESLSPMRIAHNTLLTAREKIELLRQLKSEASGILQEGDPLGFDPAEIDAAIAEVRKGVQDDVGADTVLRGDF